MGSPVTFEASAEIVRGRHHNTQKSGYTVNADIQILDTKGNVKDSASKVLSSEYFKNLKPAVYAVRVRSVYKKAGSVVGRSNWSKKTYTVCDPVPDKTATNNNLHAGKNVIVWEKVAGAQKYIVYGSNTGNSYTKVKTVKGTSCNVGSTTKKYYKVVAVYSKNGKTYKSAGVFSIYTLLSI